MLYNVRNYFLAMMAFFLPVLLANTYYIDDNGRSIEGYYFWGIDGRPLAELVMKSIMLSRGVVDIFPLNIILSCLVLAISFSLLLSFLEKYSIRSKWSFPLPLLITFNIFYMEPSYYRFDSITISLAIALSISTSVYFLKGKWDYLITTVATVATLSLYQTSVNIIMLLCVANAVLLAVKEDNLNGVIKPLAIKGLAVASGGAIYFLFVLPRFVIGNHGADHPEVNIISALSNLAANFISILNIMSSYISLNYGQSLLMSVFFLAIASCLFLGWRLKDKGFILRIFIILSPAICLILMLGVSLTLDRVLSSPRVYTSFGAMAYFCFAVFYISLPKSLKCASVICLPLLFFQLIVIFAYGNAMKAQDARNLQTLNAIGQAIGVSDAKIKVIFNGDYPYSSITRNTLNSFPEIGQLIPNYFTNWWWSFQFMRRNGYSYDFPSGQDASYAISALNICSDSEIKKEKDFTVYRKNEYALIDFSNSICN